MNPDVNDVISNLAVQNANLARDLAIAQATIAAYQKAASGHENTEPENGA